MTVSKDALLPRPVTGPALLTKPRFLRRHRPRRGLSPPRASIPQTAEPAESKIGRSERAGNRASPASAAWQSKIIFVMRRTRVAKLAMSVVTMSGEGAGMSWGSAGRSCGRCGLALRLGSRIWCRCGHEVPHPDGRARSAFRQAAEETIAAARASCGTALRSDVLGGVPPSAEQLARPGPARRRAICDAISS
jgi:hypothetical protein